MNKETALKRINPAFLKGICHRGLHNDRFSENGLKAFENAIKEKMPIELDVHITSDNKLVVFHDSNMKRMTGKDGIIEKLTLDEIRTNYRLLDGEMIPTLKEVLKLNNERVPMVVEMKVYKSNHKRLARAVKLTLAKYIKNKDNVILISFDPRSLFYFRKSGYIRQLLISYSHSFMFIFRHFFEGIDYDSRLMNRRAFRRYSKHHLTNLWTVDSKEAISLALPYTDIITFEHVNPKHIKKRLLHKNSKYIFKPFSEWNRKYITLRADESK